MSGTEQALAVILGLTAVYAVVGLWAVQRFRLKPAADQALILTGRTDPYTKESLTRVIPPNERAARIPFLEISIPLDLRPLRLSTQAGSRRLEASVAIDLEHAQAAARRLGGGAAADAQQVIEAILVPLASTPDDEATVRDAAEAPLRSLGLKLESLRLR